VFTEVGRYSPLTDRYALRAANAYVLYRGPDYVIARADIMRSANGGAVPTQILRGHYKRILADPSGGAVVYARTPAPLDAYRSTPDVFLENVAHPSHVVAAFDGEVVPRDAYLDRLRFLADGTLDRSFTGRAAYDIVFAKSNVPIHELDVFSMWARTDTTIALALRDAAGSLVWREERLLQSGRADRLAITWSHALPAVRLSIEFEAHGTSPGRVIVRDVRVQGQPPALADYVRQLTFPSQTALAGTHQ
jgi:hypothetical protein